jgi:3',5'-cyclic AMP phosphodiesterase CpdA
MRIAHLSDLHVPAPGAVPARRLLNKRLTGWVNLALRRADQHPLFAARAALRAIRERGDIDHVVITGDLGNLALESELERADGSSRRIWACRPQR